MSKQFDRAYGLTFPGGGSRGYYSLNWYKNFVNLWGIDETESYKYFDVVTGTSAGGIIALGVAAGKSLEEMVDFFEQEVPWVFTIRTAADVLLGSNNASLPSNRPAAIQKAIISGNNDQWYRSVSTSSNYGSARLKTALNTLFGNLTMQDLKVGTIVTAFNFTTKKRILFSNLNYAEFIGQNELLTDVALATSAAPIYLPPIKIAAGVLPFIFPNDNLVDGGLYANNPALLAYTWARALKPCAKTCWLLSVGTGKDDPTPADEVDPDDPPPIPPFYDGIRSVQTIAEAAIDSTLASDILTSESTNLPHKLAFYETNPILSPSFDTDLDNTDADFLLYLKDLAQSEIFDDSLALTTFLQKRMGAFV